MTKSKNNKSASNKSDYQAPRDKETPVSHPPRVARREWPRHDPPSFSRWSIAARSWVFRTPYVSLSSARLPSSSSAAVIIARFVKPFCLHIELSVSVTYLKWYGPLVSEFVFNIHIDFNRLIFQTRRWTLSYHGTMDLEPCQFLR